MPSLFVCFDWFSVHVREIECLSVIEDSFIRFADFVFFPCPFPQSVDVATRVNHKRDYLTYVHCPHEVAQHPQEVGEYPYIEAELVLEVDEDVAAYGAGHCHEADQRVERDCRSEVVHVVSGFLLG